MAALWLDVRYALRMMAKSPGLTAVLVITLALGIGATTTIFSVVNSVLLRPLPYPDADRLAVLATEIIGKLGFPHLGFAVDSYNDLHGSCRTCAGVAAWERGDSSLAGGDRPVRGQATFATHDLLPLIGVRPLIGRWFDASEDRSGDPTVILLGYDLWQRVFGGDPGILGKQVQIDARPVSVIGVMPRGFRFPERSEVWGPRRLDAAKDQASFNLDVLVRLGPGASLAALDDELAVQSKAWTDWLNAITAKL